jgi:uncharacterized membrane protein
MIRKTLSNHISGTNKEFRFRGIEPGRIENFTDACFALAITLLLISTSPPSSFIQVKKFAWEVIPFGLCITLVILIWHQHFIFFFRYGLRNSTVLILNAIFIIIVLFYVYPLKFLARAILIPVTGLFGATEFNAELRQTYAGSNMAELMIIYGLGATAVFLVLALLYRYALKKSDELELNEIEKFDTHTSMLANVLMACVPLISVIIAFLLRSSMWAGLISGLSYFLYSPAMSIFWRIKSRKRKQILVNTSNSESATSAEQLNEVESPVQTEDE